MFSLGVDSSTFGDIIITGNKYYIYVLDEMKDYFKLNLTKIKNSNVLLEERDLSILKDYRIEYLELEIISSSERVDTIISRLIGINRNRIKDLIKKKDILLNYSNLIDCSKKLQINDVFSIKKYGKYKYMGIIKNTKSGNLVIKIDKYL